MSSRPRWPLSQTYLSPQCLFFRNRGISAHKPHVTNTALPMGYYRLSEKFSNHCHKKLFLLYICTSIALYLLIYFVHPSRWLHLFRELEWFYFFLFYILFYYFIFYFYKAHFVYDNVPHTTWTWYLLSFCSTVQDIIWACFCCAIQFWKPIIILLYYLDVFTHLIA